MRGAVVAHQPRAVQDHAHGELLDHHVVHHLVVAALHEGRVDAAEGLEALDGHARRKRHGVLLRDAHVEGALGEALAKDVHACGLG